MSTSLVLLALLASTGPSSTPAAQAPDVDVTVKVDSARREVLISAGPWHLMNMPPMVNHAMMDMGAAHDTPLMRFAWPVGGWFVHPARICLRLGEPQLFSELSNDREGWKACAKQLEESVRKLAEL